MDPITMALIFGGAGLAKSHFIDKPKEEAQRKLASETQRYSPWTGLQAGPINEADPFGSVLQGAATGASMGQNMEAAAANKKLTEAQTNYFNKGAAASPPTVNMSAPQIGMEMPGADFGNMDYDTYRSQNPWGGFQQKRYSVLGG